MKETSLLVKSLYVMMDTMQNQPLWFAGLHLSLVDYSLLLKIRDCKESLIFNSQSYKLNSRMLGYCFGSPTKKSHFGSVPADFAMDNVKCVGNETSIFNCAHDTVDNCGSSKGAGVICSNDPGNAMSF